MRLAYLEHSRNPARGSRRAAAALSLAVIVCCLMVFFTSIRASKLTILREALAEQTHQGILLQHERDLARVLIPPPGEVARINRAIAELNLPWPDLLRIFEDIPTDKIELLELAPDAGQHVLRVKAAAKDEHAMLDFAGNLEKEPLVAEVRWIHHESGKATPGMSVEFELNVYWRRQDT